MSSITMNIDKYLYDEYDLKRHKTGYSSIQTQTNHDESSIVLFNQHYKTMKLKPKIIQIHNKST